ncbi:MarR family winged helix-turn-helix transcriptional regulator [Jiangella sp. DSM 45060]|uniref:MarR family winged helix-turn-helix transcriptional regulator n=1 Tax=Jiangella sp. DSM 45060 TaxID=1798224 RepID=UPI00087D0081|nr:MarR family transcriptional regulator [Jiangella sp. DSM 45060]SDT68211.1 DNA-binding transcriptional regulator, MarR family [Jiangella sp. DSM 45060]
MKKDPTAGYLVWRLATKWGALLDRTLAPFGLTQAQFSVLATLYGVTRAGGKPSQRELSDHTGLDPVFVSKLVRTLEGNGLLLRTADPADSRAVRLALTDRGADVIEAAGARVMTLQNQLAEPLGGRDSERTREFVATLTTLLDAPPPDLGRTP